MFPTAYPTNEQTLAMPTSRLVMGVLLAAGLTGAAWVGICLVIIGQTAAIQAAGLVGAGVVAVVAAMGIVAMTPWKTRPVTGWMTMWLAGTVIRMLATPAVTFLLYSAIPLNAMALTLSVAIAYLVVVLTEATIVARHVGRVVYPSAGSSNVRSK
jgi:hypothetical protein